MIKCKPTAALLVLFSFATVHADNSLVGFKNPSSTYPGNQIKSREHSTLTVAYKIAPSMVDHSADGESTPVELKRFEGMSVSGLMPVNRWLVIEAELFQKSMASKRHQYDVHNGKLAFHADLPWSTAGFDFGVDLGVWGNAAGSIQKNTGIKFDDYKFSSILIHDPSDLQTDISLNWKKRLGDNWRLGGTAGFGLSRVSFKRLTGEYEKNGCSYTFDVTRTEGTTIQTGTCGRLLAAEVYMPSEQALEANIGFLPSNDIEYDAPYWMLGSELNYRKGRWLSSLGYKWQGFDRGTLEDRVSELGKPSYTYSHAVNWSLAYALYRNIDLLLDVEYESHRLLTSQPLVYNAYTSGNFEKSGAFISLGMRVGL